MKPNRVSARASTLVHLWSPSKMARLRPGAQLRGKRRCCRFGQFQRMFRRPTADALAEQWGQAGMAPLEHQPQEANTAGGGTAESVKIPPKGDTGTRSNPDAGLAHDERGLRLTRNGGKIMGGTFNQSCKTIAWQL